MTKKTTKKMLLLGVLVLSLVWLAACKPSAPPPDEEKVTENVTTEVAEPESGTEPTEVLEATEAPQESSSAGDKEVVFRVAAREIMSGFNPYTSWSTGEQRALFFDALIEWDGKNGYVGALAESWEVSDDGKVYTFKIRPNLTFHDGTPCTAEEIAWSINMVVDYKLPTMESAIEGISKVEALDPLTVRITLDTPFADFIGYTRLGAIYITPPSIWKGMTRDEILEYNEPDSLTGTGAFKISDYVLDEYLIMEAFDDYWRGRPVVDKVIFQNYATDDAKVQALLSKEVDFIDWAPYTGAKALYEADHLEVVPVGSFGCYNLIINSLKDGPYPKVLNDPVVRRAIAYAIDKESIVNIAYAGYGKVADSIIPPTMGKWYNSELEQIPFDTEEGSRLLEEAGYVDSDGDGIREDKDGNPMSFRLNANESSKNARLLEIISDGLKQIGIDAPPVLVSELDDFYPEYDFDIIVWGWDWDVEPASALVPFRCSEVGDGGWNDAGYCNPHYDELYEQQATELDPEKRKDIIWEMQKIFYEDRAYIMLIYDVNIQAYNKEKFDIFEYSPITMLEKRTFVEGMKVVGEQ